MKVSSNVDEKTILTLLDVSGSCIVDIIYNHIYDRAIAIHEKSGKGLTDCYRQTLREYVQERGNPKFYTLLINSIHHYTRMSTVYNEISYPDCVNLYSSLFIPHMYHASLTNDQKINILTMMLGDSIEDFVSEVLCTHISCIIDDHNDPINIELLQDSILKILLSKRDQNYERFIASQKQTPETKSTKSSPKKDTEKAQILAKLTNAFKKSVNERISLKKKNSLLIKKNKSLTTQFQDLRKLFLEQLSVQKQQASVISKLQQDNKIKSEHSSPKKTIYQSYEEEKEEFEDDELFSVQYVEN